MVDHDAAALRGSCFLFFQPPREAELRDIADISQLELMTQTSATSQRL